MPRYTVCFTDSDRVLRDEGVELADDAAARAFAAEAARELTDCLVHGIDWDRWRVEVTDETGAFLFTIPFPGPAGRRTEYALDPQAGAYGERSARRP